MAKFVVLTRLTEVGLRALLDGSPSVPDIHAEVAALGGDVVHQFALVGDYHFCTIVDLPDNASGRRLTVPAIAADSASRVVLPGIDQNLFIRLLSQTTESVGPHRWQISAPARLVRRVLRRRELLRDLARYCRPFTVRGQEHFASVSGPVLVIANHSSHLDMNALYGALPSSHQRRIAFGAAADRWFLKGRKGYRNQGWYRSLAFNAFPIKRGGGRASLAYAEWLIDRGWSVAIFPEGTRSTTGHMARFRVGPALVAVAKGVPVVPMYMEGLREIRPKGSKTMVPGPVTVAIGPPLRFAANADPSEATHRMAKAMDALRAEVHQPGHTRAAEPPRALAVR